MIRRAGTSCIGAARRAFTLFELLVVVAIILVLVAVTTPAIGTLIASANFSAAVNSVTGTLGNARAIAISRGVRTGVVFSFDIVDEVYSLRVVELAPSGSRGQLTTYTTSTTATIDASVFVPARNSTPVTLPKGTGIYALSFTHMFDPNGAASYEVLDPSAPVPLNLWYAGEVFEHPDNANWLLNPWILPRNDPRLYIDLVDDVEGRRDLSLQDVWDTAAGPSFAPTYAKFSRDDAIRAVRHAQSFIVMFDSDGIVVPAVDDAGADVFNGFLEFPTDPIDLEPDDPNLNDAYDSDITFDPEIAPPGNINLPSANPEVWVRAVDQLAVVEFRRLSSGSGVDFPWLLHPSTSELPWPPFRGTADTQNSPLASDSNRLDEMVRDVSQWIDLNGEIIGFDRYTGVAQRRRSEQ